MSAVALVSMGLAASSRAIAAEIVAALPAATAASSPAGKIKTLKAEWVTGLKQPQGLARTADGTILVADYSAGTVLRYSADGKPLGTLAQGLKSPAQVLVDGDKVYVSERKANRVIQIAADGTVTPVGGAVTEPLGLARNAAGQLFVVAHTTSRVLRLDGAQWQPIYTAPPEDGDKARYGYRCLAYDGAFLMTDEVGEQVVMLTPGGRIATWVQGISDPSGIVIGPDGATYISNEGDGGQLSRVGTDGKPVVIAEGLGQPRGVLFLDASTILVSDRGGKVWKLALTR